MKNIIRVAALCSVACITGRAAPFMAVGDNAELFVTAGAMVQADDNIYLSSSGKSDTVYSFTPGLDLVFGKGSQTTGDVYFNDEIRRYSSHSKQDIELASFGGKAGYSNGLTKADFNASYAEIAQNQVGATLTSDIARRNLTMVGGTTEFSFSEKMLLGIGANYVKTHYLPTAFISSDIFTVPIDLYYQQSEKLAWSVGYAYRSTQLSGSGDDNNDSFLNIGARGEFSPKLTGQVRVGYTQRSFDRAGNQSLLGVASNLAYQPSEKTTVQLNFSNDFGNAGTGDSTKNLTFGGSVYSKMSDQWALNAALNWRAIQYSKRTDDYVEGSVGVSYIYNSYFNFTASYTYRNNSSDLASAGTEFTNNVFALGGNVRY